MFTIDKCLKNIIKPIFNDKYEDRVDIEKIFSKTVIETKNLSKYLMFLDFEVTQGILGSLNNEVCVPSIREIGMVLIESEYFYNNLKIKNEHIKIFYKTNLISFKEFIMYFLHIYYQFDKPTIYAHNGLKFDFIILLSCLQRYLTKNEKIRFSNLDFKFVDTYNIIKNTQFGKNVYHKYKSTYGVMNLQNAILYKKLAESYYRKNLSIYAHNAIADSLMTVYWFHTFIHFIYKNNKFTNYWKLCH